jgi:hypothetical protein
MKIIEKRVYYVSACERLGNWWDCDVLASDIREARRVGVAVLEHKGLINRRRILKTDICETGVTASMLQA